MKNIYKFLFVILCMELFFSSCYDDKSTFPSDLIDGVVIDTSGMRKGTMFDVIQFARLKLSPKILKGGEDAKKDPDLSYEWRMSVQPESTDKIYEIIGTRLDLDTTINSPVSPGVYELWFVVTDNTNTLKTYMRWGITVISDLSEGLIVADTRDGMNTDLSLIMGEGISMNYLGEDNIRRDIYSAVNGELIHGLVKDLCFTLTGYGSIKTIMGFTSNSVFMIDGLTYNMVEMNNGMFYVPSSRPYHPQFLKNGSQSIAYVDEGKLYFENRMGFEKFQWKDAPVEGDYTIDGGLALDFIEQVESPGVVFYDAVEGKFWFLRDVYQKIVKDFEYNSGDDFNPRVAPGLRNIHSDLGENSEAYFLMQNLSDSRYSIYSFKKGIYGYPTPIALPCAGQKLDIPSGTQVGNALPGSYVFCENQSVMYYATPDNVYALSLRGTLSEDPKWGVPSGEKITGLKMYRQAIYSIDKNPGYDDDWNPLPFISTNILQLLCTTYNETTGEGKVYCLPIINLGRGDIDKTKIKERGKFGRILAVEPQGK